MNVFYENAGLDVKRRKLTETFFKKKSEIKGFCCKFGNINQNRICSNENHTQKRQKVERVAILYSLPGHENNLFTLNCNVYTIYYIQKQGNHPQQVSCVRIPRNTLRFIPPGLRVHSTSASCSQEK